MASIELVVEKQGSIVAIEVRCSTKVELVIVAPIEPMVVEELPQIIAKLKEATSIASKELIVAKLAFGRIAQIVEANLP